MILLLLLAACIIGFKVPFNYPWHRRDLDYDRYARSNIMTVHNNNSHCINIYDSARSNKHVYMQRAMSIDDLILGEIVSKSYYLEDSVAIIIIIPQTFDTQFYRCYSQWLQQHHVE